jgi:hypothetical protein
MSNVSRHERHLIPWLFMNPSDYNGKSVVFIESGEMCLATIVSAAYDTEGFKATFEASSSPAVACELRQFQQHQDGSNHRWSEKSPFGQRWDVSASMKEFFHDPECWQASFLWGGGFRVFVNQLFVERFLNHDIAWLEDHARSDG